MIIEASTPMLTASLSPSVSLPLPLSLPPSPPPLSLSPASHQIIVEWWCADLNSEDFVVFPSALSLSLSAIDLLRSSFSHLRYDMKWESAMIVTCPASLYRVRQKFDCKVA